MFLESTIEPNIHRCIMLTEKLYYRSHMRVRKLAEELAVDRNTILSDIDALEITLARFIAQTSRSRGVITVRFNRNVGLLDLIQAVYRDSLVLQLCNTYIDGPVEIMAFATKYSLSLSRAYALNKRVVELLASVGVCVVNRHIQASEFNYRFLALLVRGMLGYETFTMRLYALDIEAAIARTERKLGRCFFGVNRAILRVGIVLSLDRSNQVLDADFLEAVTDAPSVDFFKESFHMANRRPSLQEARFLAFLFACVDAQNRFLCKDEECSWLDGAPEFMDLLERFTIRYGISVTSTDLFLGALRTLYIYQRFGLANFPFMQHRTVQDESAGFNVVHFEIVQEWLTAFDLPSTVNMHLISVFTLRVLPLIAGRPGAATFSCAIATCSELNRMHYEVVLHQAFGDAAHVIDTPFVSIAEARRAHHEEAYTASSSNIDEPFFIVTDREFPETLVGAESGDVHEECKGEIIVETSLVLAHSHLEQAIRLHLS